MTSRDRLFPSGDGSEVRTHHDCPVCGRSVFVNRRGTLRSHVRTLCQVGIDGEPERGLCPGSRFAVVHDGYAVHPDLTPYLTGFIRGLAAELRCCLLDHPEDERLGRAEANLRWLVGERV